MKNKSLKTSVIIPAYNEEKYLAACLNSLINQTESPDEIIVIDNNSMDHTVSVAKQFPVRVVTEKKQGMIHARNRGFNEAQFDIIARCDADTILPVDWIKTMKKHMELDDHVQALTGPVLYHDLPLPSLPLVKLYLKVMKKILKGNEIFVGPNMILRKTAWEKIKLDICLDDTKVHEDIDLAIHLFKKGFYLYTDFNLVVKTSGRRLKNQYLSFFIEYPKRLIDMLKTHKML